MILYPWLKDGERVWLRYTTQQPNDWKDCVAIIQVTNVDTAYHSIIYELSPPFNQENYIHTYTSLDDAKSETDKLLKSLGYILVDEKHMVLL